MIFSVNSACFKPTGPTLMDEVYKFKEVYP